MSKPNEVIPEAQIKAADFIAEYGIACGGNWAAMLMYAIENGLPEVYKELDDNKSYRFDELYEVLLENV